MKKISVIGLGSVGSSVLNVMSKYHSCIGFDTDGRGSWSEVIESDFAFICVPTNANHDESLDVSIVAEVIKRLNDDDYTGIIVIKSTLHPYTTEKLQNKFTSQKICYMPEYLREKDAQEWFENPDRLVLTEPKEVGDIVLDLFAWVDKSVPRIIMTPLEAEIAKLAHNAYIATKVTFTCEIERICIQHNASAKKIMNSIWVDRRIGNKAHFEPELGGFDGKCVPKDTFALAKFDSDSKSLFQILKKRGSKDQVREYLLDARTKSSAFPMNSKPSLYGNVIVLLTNLFVFTLIAGIGVFTIIGLTATSGWYDDSPIVGESLFLEENVSVTTGDIVFASDILFSSTGVHTTSSHQCYTNYEGGSDCSTTYHDYLKYEWKGYWFYGPFDELRGCLDLPCDVIGEVQESEIIWVLDWRHANE